MRISDWSSDVCSSDLIAARGAVEAIGRVRLPAGELGVGERPAKTRDIGFHPRGERRFVEPILLWHRDGGDVAGHACSCESRSPEPGAQSVRLWIPAFAGILGGRPLIRRSEEHTSELPSLMRISYDGFCLHKT